ncbi:MAG: polysaccharide lyase [Marinilabiliaceae bacterium]|nr:polysaccharide lyase [Marinilabiliaceae bacterium]
MVWSSRLGLGVSVILLMGSCQDGAIPINNDDPDLLMNFEGEPDHAMPTRITDPNGNSNGCLREVSFNADYNYQICNAPNCPAEDVVIEPSDEVARAGERSLRFFMKPSPLNDWPGSDANHRAELGPDYDSAIHPFPDEGEERWYAMSIFFPEAFVFAPESIESDVRFAFAQWQHGSAGAPIFALEVYGDQIALTRQEGDSRNSKWAGAEMLTTIKKGEWIDLVLQVKWSKSKGRLKIWANGAEVFNNSSIQTMYSNLDRGGAFKFGIYYWRWKRVEDVTKSLNAGIENRELFIDEVSQYKGGNGFTVVAPQ